MAKDELLLHGPELPTVERIRRYRHNIRTIHASGCAVPTTALIDILGPVDIELWFADSAFRSERLKNVGVFATP